MNNRVGFGLGLTVGSMLGVGISMMNADNVKRVKKSLGKTARKMKLNRMIGDIAENFVDMF